MIISSRGAPDSATREEGRLNSSLSVPVPSRIPNPALPCGAPGAFSHGRSPSMDFEKLVSALSTRLPATGPASPCAGASGSSPQQQPLRQTERKFEDLANRLGVALNPTSCDTPSGKSVNLHAALDLLQLPLEAVQLPLSASLLPEVPEEFLVSTSPSSSSRASQMLAADACSTSQRGASPLENPPAPTTVVEQRHSADEDARRELAYAAKRYQRQRRLLLQQLRNRLHAALQQISDLQEAKDAAEKFLEELKQEVAAVRAERDKGRSANTDGATPQQQEKQQGSLIYFDPMPPPSSEALSRYPKQQEVRAASEEETSDVGDSPSGHEGSANVERLMQRYYATLIADVDQAAKEHAKAQAYGCSAGDENPGKEEIPIDVGSTGGSVAPYYFDPFSPDREASRRGQQGTVSVGASSATASSAANGAPSGGVNNQTAAALVARSHPMLSAAAEKVRGVAFCKSNRYWICTRMEHGKQQCRYFSVKHLGFECARREAILLRQQWKGDVNEEVLKALEEEKAAMDAAAAVPGGGGAPPRTRGATVEAQSPSLRPTAPLTPPVSSPSKAPAVGAASDGGPPPRKEKTGPMKRRRDALTRPLVIDRSGTMPRPPPEFDFASDSDFLTDNEEDREEEALAMNAAVLAECSERSARATQASEDGATQEDDPEALLNRRRREIVANCFMGVTSTADALVLLSRRLTYAVKIPGISFHKGVESWLCTWKEPDSRTISRYFRCSRFGFRRGFKLSVFTLLLNAPRAAAMRAFIAIKEIKRRRRAAQRGDLFNPHEPSLERPLSCEVPEPLDRGQSLSSSAEARKGSDAAGASREQALTVNASSRLSNPEAQIGQRSTQMLAKQSGTADGINPSVGAPGFAGLQLVPFGGVTAPGGELGVTDSVTAKSTNDSVPSAVFQSIHNAESPVAQGDFHVLHSDPVTNKMPLVGADALKCHASPTFTNSPRAENNAHTTLAGQRPVMAQFETT